MHHGLLCHCVVETVEKEWIDWRLRKGVAVPSESVKVRSSLRLAVVAWFVFLVHKIYFVETYSRPGGILSVLEGGGMNAGLVNCVFAEQGEVKGRAGHLVAVAAVSNDRPAELRQNAR